MVDKKLEQTYARLEGGERPAKRRGLRSVRAALAAVAVIAALCVTAGAAYNIFRQEVPVDPAKTAQGVLGNGQPAWEEHAVYNEDGMMLGYWPNRDAVQVDEAQAQALLGDYLPECGYQWQIGDYIFTVEGYVLDEHTGAARFYYSVENPNGFPEGTVNQESGTLSYLSHITVLFSTNAGPDQTWFVDKITFVDLERSTPEKLYLMVGAANGAEGWKAEDGLRATFRITGETTADMDVLAAEMELPGVKSLPAVSAADPATGDAKLELSAIGIKLYSVEDIDLVDYVALDFADGTQYVLVDRASALDNTAYAGATGNSPDWTLCYVFNQLVDPSQVTAVTVNSQRYEMN